MISEEWKAKFDATDGKIATAENLCCALDLLASDALSIGGQVTELTRGIYGVCDALKAAILDISNSHAAEWHLANGKSEVVQ